MVQLGAGRVTPKPEASVEELTVSLRVVKIGSSFIGIAQVGGFDVRGQRCDTAAQAAQNLFANLGAINNDNAAMGIELALAGMTLQDLGPRGDRIAELEKDLGIGEDSLE
jgi:hypothetical protein